MQRYEVTTRAVRGMGRWVSAVAAVDALEARQQIEERDELLGEERTVVAVRLSAFKVGEADLRRRRDWLEGVIA